MQARQEIRAHVDEGLKRAKSDTDYETINKSDSDYETIKKGSSHELRCVKNQRSYEWRMAQRGEDLRNLTVLEGGFEADRVRPTISESHRQFDLDDPSGT